MSFPHTERRPQNNSDPKGGSTGPASFLSQIRFKPVAPSKALFSTDNLSELTQPTCLNLCLSPPRVVCAYPTASAKKNIEETIP